MTPFSNTHVPMYYISPTNAYQITLSLIPTSFMYYHSPLPYQLAVAFGDYDGGDGPDLDNDFDGDNNPESEEVTPLGLSVYMYPLVIFFVSSRTYICTLPSLTYISNTHSYLFLTHIHTCPGPSIGRFPLYVYPTLPSLTYIHTYTTLTYS